MHLILFSTFFRVGPLTDLLEEDSELPSRETSGKKRPDWSFLPRPKTPGTTSSSSESYAVSNILSLFDFYTESMYVVHSKESVAIGGC